MAQWLVTQDNAQFAVDDLDSLKQMAAAGRLDSGDMVQPPGATDWLYASEVPELNALLGDGNDTLEETTDDLIWRRRRGLGALGTAAAVITLLGVVVVGTAIAVFFGFQMPTGDESLIGESGFTYSQVLTTESGIELRNEPSDNTGSTARLGKDEALDLLAKRGDFYKVRVPDSGETGWVKVDQVLPMYLLGGGEVMAEYDPLYNPDRYVEVRNATWMQIDQQNSQLTVFRFMLENSSRYDMTGLVLLATIKDSKGNELERVEIPVEGIIPSQAPTMVGTLKPDGEAERSLTEFTFSKMADRDPELQLIYSDGVEVVMTTEDFTEAEIDLLEVLAVPPTEG